MKKLIFGLLLLGATSIMAQSPISPGEKQLNAGFGISTWGLPVYVGVDFGVAQDFSLGGVVSYRGYNDVFGDW
jgi:outer membrane immunogenic protein